MTFRNANTLVEFGIQDRLNEINHVDGESYLCTAGNNGIFDTAKEAVEFLPDVLVTNFRGPTMNLVSLYNDFIHGKIIQPLFVHSEPSRDLHSDLK